VWRKQHPAAVVLPESQRVDIGNVLSINDYYKEAKKHYSCPAASQA
jgi:hypothetical protein